MANGHVEIHDPFSNHNGTSGPKPTPDSDSMEDSVELRLLMAYAKRRQPRKETPSPAPVTGGNHVNESSSLVQEEMKNGKRRKRRMSMKVWKWKLFSCVKPQTEDEEQPQQNEMLPDVDKRCGPLRESVVEEEEDELKETANRLTKIADEIQFLPPDVETDSPEDGHVDANVEKMIGLLLRSAGDQLNEAELKDASISRDLFLNYGFFKLLMTTLLTRMGLQSRHPDSPGPKASPKTQIAVACEVTSRLSAVNSLPRNQLLVHGARYLQHYYSPWALQQGGYEEAFYSDDEDDDDQ